jgi:hypothetical protein
MLLEHCPGAQSKNHGRGTEGNVLRHSMHLFLRHTFGARIRDARIAARASLAQTRVGLVGTGTVCTIETCGPIPLEEGWSAGSRPPRPLTQKHTHTHIHTHFVASA